MPGLPVYHQVGSSTSANNAPVQTGGGLSLGGAAGTHWKFVAWVVILGVIVPGFILGALDFYGFRFVFKHR